MGNTNLKSQKSRQYQQQQQQQQHLAKNGGLSLRKQQAQSDKTSLGYPNYMYHYQHTHHQSHQDLTERWLAYNNQYPYYYNSDLLLNQTKFNPFQYFYDYAFGQSYTPSISSYGGYYSVDKPYYETPVKDNSKYTIKGSKKQEVKDSPKHDAIPQLVPNNYRNVSPYYSPSSLQQQQHQQSPTPPPQAPYYPYGQNYFNYYPSFFSYYSGYYQPYSQIYMNLTPSTYAPSPKIKVKDYVIPLPVEKVATQSRVESSNQISSSSSFSRKKSKKTQSQQQQISEESEQDSEK